MTLTRPALRRRDVIECDQCKKTVPRTGVAQRFCSPRCKHRFGREKRATAKILGLTSQYTGAATPVQKNNNENNALQRAKKNDILGGRFPARRWLSVAGGKARPGNSEKDHSHGAGVGVGPRREHMPRPLQRVRLESGLKLNLNALAQRGFIRPGTCTGPLGIAWTNSYTGEQFASGLITAEMSGRYEGWFQIQIGQLHQRINLITQPRHFGGQQWYFVCPYTHRPASVLWKPPGAQSFASRQKWGRQVAYSSQFLDRIDRAHRGQAKIKSRLRLMGGFDQDEWDFPPKPKWMRWRTYNRAEEKFNHYESILDEGIVELVARLGHDLRSK